MTKSREPAVKSEESVRIAELEELLLSLEDELDEIKDKNVKLSARIKKLEAELRARTMGQL